MIFLMGAIIYAFENEWCLASFASFLKTNCMPSECPSHNDLLSSPPTNLLPKGKSLYWSCSILRWHVSDSFKCAKYILLISPYSLSADFALHWWQIVAASFKIISRIYANGKSVHWSCRILKWHAGRTTWGSAKYFAIILTVDPCNPKCVTCICCKHEFSISCFLPCWFC